MAINIPSLQAKLLNIAHQNGLDFQLMLNRFGAEQFLARLSQSTFSDQFVFKGGSLLAYLIDTERKTKDLDFSIRQISHHVEEVRQAVESILAISMEDGILWEKIEGHSLNHPDMDLPGVRVFCHFVLGKMKGRVQMDMAISEVPEAIKTPLTRIRYKGEPLMGSDFSLWTYPKEKIFAEKFQIAFIKAEKNTRMRDYYDLFKLSQDSLDPKLLKQSLKFTFTSKKTPIVKELVFKREAQQQLQTYWEGFIRKSKLKDAPRQIEEVLFLVNQKLGEAFTDE